MSRHLNWIGLWPHSRILALEAVCQRLMICLGRLYCVTAAIITTAATTAAAAATTTTTTSMA